MDASASKNKRPPKRTASSHQFGWLAALFIAACLVVPSAAAAATEPARGADSFVESIGVNTHTLFTGTVYSSNFSEVKQRLEELGVRHIREDLGQERPDQYQRLNELAAAGIKSTLILGDPRNGAAGLDELVSTLQTKLSGAVDAVEGPNEFDTRGGSNWAPELNEYQQHLYDAIKSDPSLAPLSVIGPSIVQRAHQEALGDISSKLDYGNIHSYPDGEPPESNLSSYLGRAAFNSGSKPVFATETGYNNALNWNGENRPVSEEAMATYMPRLFLEYFRRGVARTYSYELVNEQPDPGLTDRESNFGLLRNDLSEKPAFVALRNTIAILKDPGPVFAPESLGYTLGGDQADLHQVLLQKRDGSYYLALWRASSIWDPARQVPLDPPSTPVTLSFDRQVKSAQRYLPNASAAPVSSLRIHADRPLSVNVGPQVVILGLKLGAATQGRIRLWVSKHSVQAGGRLAVRGRLPSQTTGHSLRVKIQHWQRGWRTVGLSRTSKSGVFRKKIRMPAHIDAPASRLRVVARKAKPSKTVRVRIR